MSDHLTDDEEEVLELVSDLESERMTVVSLLMQIQQHTGAGDKGRMKAQALLKAIETSWPRGAVDELRDELADDHAQAARDRGDDAEDQDAETTAFAQAGIDAIRGGVR